MSNQVHHHSYHLEKKKKKKKKSVTTINSSLTTALPFLLDQYHQLKKMKPSSSSFYLTKCFVKQNDPCGHRHQMMMDSKNKKTKNEEIHKQCIF